MQESKPVGSMTYAESLSELEAILRTMQSDSCDIDRLAAYTRRATELLKACRSRLTATEEELQTILSTLENQSNQ
ncbi:MULTISPECIES: exodeoxyribonuclease VII small subunit [Duncaniella]|uniref:exodeoxyribonuclease VII small subunit n=1 Tax=Duncaniella TaxID=2518495 RepID=UPI0023D40A73|nr:MULTISPECIES: exodeoxyribonuclease VII small subunit [Duncaniella]MDE5689702.1 exodeoxyribonuclease VII small subunit [Duncaniella sp.]MDE5904221.1 exodeoxyribonuclease VII small subunit [Duncaniella sp.]MDE7147624.1 exodeoxyribonuclease VII small subunit [Duncaniella sp.]